MRHASTRSRSFSEMLSNGARRSSEVLVVGVVNDLLRSRTSARTRIWRKGYR